MILDWQANQNLSTEDMPPRWMWHLDHELVAWFDRLKSARGGDAGMDKNEDPVLDQLRNKMGRR